MRLVDANSVNKVLDFIKQKTEELEGNMMLNSFLFRNKMKNRKRF